MLGLSHVLGFVGLATAATNPISVKSSQWIANTQTSSNNPLILRDAGAYGTLGVNGPAVQIYSDGNQCPNQTAYNNNQCNFASPNSIVISSYVAQTVIDYGSGGSTPTFCGTGGTGQSSGSDRLHLGNLVPVGYQTSAIWYMDLSNSNCGEIDGCPVALGVASVQASSGNNVPSCSPLAGFWDPTKEPMWGTAAAFGPEIDGYIYLMGQLDGNVPGSVYNDVYLARVANGSQYDYSSYQYWNGTQFQGNRLQYPNYNGYSPSRILYNVTAFGSAYYNPYYNQYVVLAINETLGNEVIAYTAPLPQGPWSDPVIVYQNNSIGSGFDSIYLPEVLPAYDPSGKTLTFVWSLFGRNAVNGVVKLTFN